MSNVKENAERLILSEIFSFLSLSSRHNEMQPEHSPLHSGGKFTLIELLVVIAIIAILAGMLLPALNRARDVSKASKCTNNLKQIATAVQLYADNNDEFVPSPCLSANEGWPSSRYFWDFLIYPNDFKTHVNDFKTDNGSKGYIIAKSGLCPAEPLNSVKNENYNKPHYAPCQGIYPAKRRKDGCCAPFRISRQKNHAKRFFVADVWRGAGSYFKDETVGSYEWDINCYDTAYAGTPASRHSKTVSVNFLDGHVEKSPTVTNEAEPWKTSNGYFDKTVNKEGFVACP